LPINAVESEEVNEDFLRYLSGERERAILAVLGELGHIPVTPQLTQITDGVLSPEIKLMCDKLKRGDISSQSDPRYNIGMVDGVKSVMVMLGFRNVKNHAGNIMTEVPQFLKQEIDMYLGGATVNVNFGSVAHH